MSQGAFVQIPVLLILSCGTLNKLTSPISISPAGRVDSGVTVQGLHICEALTELPGTTSKLNRCSPERDRASHWVYSSQCLEAT